MTGDATSGNIPLTTTPAYCTYAQWFGKYGVSTTDESEAQFATDLREAHEIIRGKCFYLVREKILYKNSDNIAYLPIKFLTDGNMSGTVDADDVVIHELDSDGLSYDSVSNDTYIDSVNDFNNSITFTDDSSDLTRQLYITYYACSRPFDEVLTGWLKRIVMAQVTMLMIERLRIKWGLKGTTGWTAGGTTINRDVSAYKQLYNEAEAEIDKYAYLLKPTVLKGVRTGQGRGWRYDPNVAYSSQVLARSRVGHNIRFI